VQLGKEVESVNYNMDDILRTLELFTQSEQVYELRLFNVNGKGTVSGYFNDIAKLAEECAKWSGKCPGIYITVNPVNPALLGRANNRTIPYAKNTTKDSEILRLEWLYIDIDPVRPSGINASNDEKKLAFLKAKEVYAYLKEIGFPDGIVADSGNGFHLKYRISFPNEQEYRELNKNFLKVLDLRFSDENVKIDTTTSNPARICKVYGTLSCKGDHTEERPHRLNKILFVPDEIICVDANFLRKLTDRLPSNEYQAKISENIHNNPFDIKDVGAWLDEKGIKVKSIGEWNNGKKYLLDQCVWDPSHTDNSAIVVQFPDGRIIAMCQHNSCNGKGFADFRNTVEPGWRRQQKVISVYEEDNEEVCLTYKFPEPINDLAYHGLAGEIVKAIEPHTEGDPVALLVNFLTFYGNVIGDNAHVAVEATKHPGRLFSVSVGDSAVGRKGTSTAHIKRIFEMVAADYIKNNEKSGLTSGEGLIYHVRDPVYKYEETTKDGVIVGEEKLVDSGVSDKRLLVIESEMSTILKVAKREGNTLTEVIRKMWDDGTAGTLTKNNPNKTTNAHVSIIGHITPHELIKNITDTDMANGFANRYLWFCVRRSKLLPFGGQIERVNFQPMLEKLKASINFSKKAGRIEFDNDTKTLWASVYTDLTSPNGYGSPLIKDITSRMAPQVLRVALLYALLDCSPQIKQPHLLAALSVAEYSINSCKYIFGNVVGNSLRDEIYKHIKRSSTNGLSKTEIHQCFNNNKSADEINTELAHLLEQQAIIEKKEGKKRIYFSNEN
jgi:hypothetical protein